MNNTQPQTKPKASKKKQRARTVARAQSTLDAQTLSMLPPAPRVVSGKGGSIRVKNSEILQTVAWNATSGAIPAGGTSTKFQFGTGGGLTSATWLNTFGTLFDKFKVNELEIWFQPVTSTSSSGAIAIWFDSDPSAPTPANFTSVSGNVGASAGAVFQPLRIKVNQQLLNRLPQYLTSLGGVASQLESSCPGSVMFAQSSLLVGSSTGGVTLGYIWISYDVTFLGPSSTTS